MHQIFIIRHGESTANVGAISSTPGAIPLSEKGKRQAINLIDILSCLNVTEVFCSAFLRAQQTIEPFIKVSGVPMQIIPTNGCRVSGSKLLGIEEFTFLCPSKYANTTPEDRREARNLFWAKGDLDFQDSNQSESFRTLLERVCALQTALPLFKPNTVIVGHGLFFMTLLTKIKYPELTNSKLMLKVHKYIYKDERNLGNAQIVPITVKNGKLSVRTIP